MELIAILDRYLEGYTERGAVRCGGQVSVYALGDGFHKTFSFWERQLPSEDYLRRRTAILAKQFTEQWKCRTSETQTHQGGG